MKQTKIISSFGLCIILAFLVFWISNYFYFDHNQGLNRDFIQKVLGDYRRFFSGYSFLQADRYLHGGLAHPGLEYGTDNAQKHLRKQPQTYDLLDKEQSLQKKLNSANVLLCLRSAQRLTKHIHLSGQEAKEMLPWFYYSVKLNPHNVEAYVTGAHWLATAMDRPGKAVEFLRRGVSHNPDSWEVFFELGLIYFAYLKEYKNASLCLQKACRLQKHKDISSSSQRKIYILLAYSYEQMGQYRLSLKFYRKALVLLPQDSYLREKIDSIQSRLID